MVRTASPSLTLSNGASRSHWPDGRLDPTIATSASSSASMNQKVRTHPVFEMGAVADHMFGRHRMGRANEECRSDRLPEVQFGR